MEATLVIMDADKKIKLFDLMKKTTWTFGRETTTVHPDISVKSKIVSRNHGVFDFMDDHWFFIDNSGKNGTFINGKRIPMGDAKRRYPVLLNDGDILRVDYSDLSDPDSRGILLVYLDRRITSTREAKRIMHQAISDYV